MTHNTPDNAPTDGRGAWRKFICLACGYIYDEALGDPEEGLAAGTRFEDIPDDWQCPLCGVKKEDFEPYEEALAQAATPAITQSQIKGVVIIGAGLAGWSVVDAIRALDKQIPITLICGDSGDRYHKPMLSVAISQGKTATDLVRATAEQSAKDNQIQLLNHTFVTNIDSHAKRLMTTRGELGYDDLVFAIGANCAYPPTIAKDMAWHINHLERFVGLQQRLDTPKHVAIIGAGMVGTEFAEDLIKAGHRVSLIDIHPYPLSAFLPKVAGERILNAITSIGVAWLGGHMVQSVQAQSDGYHLSLTHCADHSVKTLVADEVVVATGLSVDERLPVRAGITFNKQTGIAVNPQTLQTNVAHIYALGDCISIDGVPCRYVAPHRPQAATIAGQILGQPTTYEHKPPMIRLKNKSINVTANGLPKATGDWQIINQTDQELSLEMVQNGEVLAKALLKTV